MTRDSEIMSHYSETRSHYSETRNHDSETLTLSSETTPCASETNPTFLQARGRQGLMPRPSIFCYTQPARALASLRCASMHGLRTSENFFSFASLSGMRRSLNRFVDGTLKKPKQ